MKNIRMNQWKTVIILGMALFICIHMQGVGVSAKEENERWQTRELELFTR